METKNNNRIIDNKSHQLEELSQYYSPDSKKLALRATASVRDIISKINYYALPFIDKDLQNSFWSKTFFQLYTLLLDGFEDILGTNLFFEENLSDSDKLSDIDPKFRKIARDLFNDGIIKNIEFAANFHDEPKAFCFGSNFGEFLKKNSDAGDAPGGGGSSGSSLSSRNEAFIRCIGELLERTCGAFYKKSHLTPGSFRELKKRGINIVNPKDFTGFSDEQVKENRSLARGRFDENSFFWWTTGKSLIAKKEILVPAQLVYVPYQYDYRRNEPFIRQPVTTGAAIYTDREEAIYRGICEVAERDAFMIFYLNKLSPPIIDLENSFSGELRYLVKLFKRYNLDINVLDITTDSSIPTFLTLIIDRTGLGPAVNFGNKSDLDWKSGIIGSIEEALKIRPWARRRFLEDAGIPERIRQKPKEIRSLKERCLFWARLEMIKEIEFFLKGPKKVIDSPPLNLDSKEKLEKSLKYFKDNNSDVIVVDITIPQARKYGFYAVMVLIPEAHPLYLWEEFKCLGGKRLYEVPVKIEYLKRPKKEEDLNPIPHPFP